jgi:putative heme-binding domain-containing protein
MIRRTVFLVFYLVPGPVLFAADRPAPARGLEPLVKLLAGSDDAGLQRDVLHGMREALQGRRLAAPPGWTEVFRKLSASSDAEVRQSVQVLSVLFGDPTAVAELRRLAADQKADASARQVALSALLERPTADLLPLVRHLVARPTDHAVRGQALRGLAAFDDAHTPEEILGHYADYTQAEKGDAVATLASRAPYALALLDAIERKQVPRADVSPYLARQMLALKNARVAERLEAVWGSVRPAAKDRLKDLARYKALAAPEQRTKADRSAGRLVFTQLCASCHTLFGEGGKIGPDLTGSQRTNPEYILTKVLDPNAVVPGDYRVTVLTTKSGRVVTGVVKEDTGKVLALQTPTELVRIPTGEVEERRGTNLSLMPEGMLPTLSEVQVRDLLAYLAGDGQVPLPKK